MRILKIRNHFFHISLLIICSHKLSAQEAKINIQQNPKFEQLLSEKRKINTSITVNERYKIQVFSGNSEKAKSTLNDCKQNFSDLDATIVFNTPNYKVWLGNFRTRIEAERNLVEIKKVYQNAFLIKPKK
ncbi:SPOR domain-containing protein [Flavobacterium seoulense]|uniref:Sporulation protein n=1 Tax=Flavobacterium seoulense TaxID=1492738 RepID=A0A066WW68_9FLAO|nr:SPOR domain-containing protein [Flavobacterium seoulense]KDN56818.1 sporulation protein [Flavobacterium seoulense]